MGAFQLGWMLRNGRGCTKNEAEAVCWFKVSAEEGCADGLVALSQCFVAGTAGLPIDFQRAEDLARQALRLAAQCTDAAAENSARRALNLSRVQGISDDLMPFISAIGRVGDACTLPSDKRHEATAEAAFALGVCLEAKHAHHDVSSLREAFLCYILSARHGHADGMHNVGAMLDVGKVTPQDHTAAASWYYQAAQHGDYSSMYAMGLAHRAGRGVPASDEKAVKWYRRAAEHGHARAWNKLGWMLEQGHGCAHSDAKAIEAYREAALLGSSKAMCHMGSLHRDGKCGLHVSSLEARKWFAAAARVGSALAKEQLALLGESDWRAVQEQVLKACAGDAAASGNGSASPTAANKGGDSDTDTHTPARTRRRRRT